MKIASASLQMEASHLKSQKTESSESLRAWIGNRRPDFEGNQRPAASQPRVVQPVQISDAGKTAQSGEAEAIQGNMDAAESDPFLSMIRALVAMLSGKEVKIFNASELQGNAPSASIPTANAPTSAQASPPASQSAGFGVEYDSHSSYTESEQTQFAASGIVRTTDGKSIEFNVSLTMERYYHEESNVSIRLGDARLKSDPLVLNFNGNAAQLTDQRFAFDLNSDGKSDEQINFVGSGSSSGFLAFDRNADGVINNGSELFGTKTGDGFAELAKFDGDKNGWIDENDAVFEQLSVWSKDSAGHDKLTSLKQANVGAISLAKVSTPFDIKDSSNALQGQIRSSSVFLQENGGGGTVQQIDLTV